MWHFSDAPATGDTTIIANLSVSGADDGIEARSTTGDITISGSGDFTGDSDGDGIGDGIDAASTSGGNIDVNVTGDVAGGSGIVLSTNLAGTIDLTTGGAVVGTAGDGINTVAVDGDTTIITSTSGGDTAIETNSLVEGDQDGIDATTTAAGAISMVANGRIRGFAGDAIVTSAIDGDTVIETNAAVTGGDDGIDATASGAGSISILATTS